MAIDQLPFNVKIPTNEPESTGIDQLDTETVEEEVTWRDFPPPGALLMRAPTEREKIAMKNFGKGLINFQEQMSLDLIPGLGEVRMQNYTNEEIDLFKQAMERRIIQQPRFTALEHRSWQQECFLGGLAFRANGLVDFIDQQRLLSEKKLAYCFRAEQSINRKPGRRRLSTVPRGYQYSTVESGVRTVVKRTP